MVSSWQNNNNNNNCEPNNQRLTCNNWIINKIKEFFKVNISKGY